MRWYDEANINSLIPKYGGIIANEMVTLMWTKVKLHFGSN